MMFYRLIVIENSLRDKTILDNFEILSATSFAAEDPSRESRMLKIRIPENEVDTLVEELKSNLIYPYYSHLYHENPQINKLIVVFEGKRINTGKKDFQSAITYGLQHDVSKEELDITPRDMSQEEW